MNEAESYTNEKRANLSARKRDRVKLPNYDNGSKDKIYHISEFLSHPSGIEAILNTSALQSFEFLDANKYRWLCHFRFRFFVYSVDGQFKLDTSTNAIPFFLWYL